MFVVNIIFNKKKAETAQLILAEHLKKANFVHVVENKLIYLMNFDEPQKEVYLYTFKKKYDSL